MSSTSKSRKDEQARERRKGKFEKLIRQAEHGSPSDYQALADFVTDEQDFEQLARLLDALSLSSIPHTPLDTSDSASMAQLQSARQSIDTLPLFFRVLRQAPHQSAALRAYHEKCLEMMLDRWGGVIAWMAFLLLHAAPGESMKQVQEACATALLQILSDPENSPSRQEIASMRGTADLVYVLLSQVDEKKKYYVLQPNRDVNPKAACLITQLFKCMFDSMPGWDAMEAKLTGMKKWKRVNMVQAFIGRAQQLVALANTKTITGIALSLEFLLQGIFSLCPNREVWDFFQRTQILYECGAALNELASKARFVDAKDWECWQAISSSVFHLTYAILNCSMNPTQEVPKLVKCGIMRTAMTCLPALKHSPGSRVVQDRSDQWKDAIQALDMIAPYFYLQRVFQASLEYGDFHFHQDLRTVFLNPTESSRVIKMAQMSQGPAEAIWRGYLRLYTQAKQAHIDRKDVPITLCGNSKHVERHPSLPEMPVRVCGKCRSILYCSRECQVEDWERFHRKECDFAAVRVQALRIPAGTRPFVQMMRDQLRHLESAATEYDLVEQVRQARAKLHRNQRNANATFPSLDFSAMHQLPYTRTGTSAGLRSNPHNPHASTSMSNDPEPGTHNDSSGRTTVIGSQSPDAGEWERRYRAYVKEATVEPEKVVLIEGTFRYAEIEDVVVRVLAKMRVGGRSGTEMGVRKYRVVGSLFKIG